HRQRAARGPGDEGERAEGAGPAPRRGLQAGDGDQQLRLPDRGRQGGAAGVRGEAPAGLAGAVAGVPAVDPRAPCLVGVAQRSWRLGDPDRVDGDAPEPLDMWEQVARAAAADTGAVKVLDRLD